MRALLRAALVALVGAAVAAPAGARPDAQPIRCELPGIHYVGTTASKQTVCFTLAPGGRRVKEFGFGYRGTCESAQPVAVTGTARVSGTAPVRAGALKLKTETVAVSGKIDGATASGTARRAWTQDARAVDPDAAAGSRIECDTGALRWTARRVS